MKKKWMVVLTVAMGVAVVSLAADLSGGKPSPDREAVQELRAQIAELRSKIQTLEGRAQSLESEVRQLKQSHSPTPLMWQPSAPSGSIPSVSAPKPPTIWGQGEVNGWTYYIVPCEQQSR